MQCTANAQLVRGKQNQNMQMQSKLITNNANKMKMKGIADAKQRHMNSWQIRKRASAKRWQMNGNTKSLHVECKKKNTKLKASAKQSTAPTTSRRKRKDDKQTIADQ